MKYAISSIAGVLFVLVACAPSPAPKPFLDAGDAGLTPCDVACAHLAAAECQEGGPKCIEVCEHVVDSGLTKLDVPCLERAMDRDAVRSCGVACK